MQVEFEYRNPGDEAAGVVPFANLITFMVQGPMLVFDLFWTRYVAVRGAAHAARNSLRVLGAEADLADVAADVEADVKAVGDLQGSMFNDALAANRAFVQSAARAALAAATDSKVCALAKSVFDASEKWASAPREKEILDILNGQPPAPPNIVVNIVEDNIGEEEAQELMPNLVENAVDIFHDALDYSSTTLINSKKDTTAAELYKQREFIALRGLLADQACGCNANSASEETRPSVRCASLRKMLDGMLTREFAAVYKYFGYKGDAFAAQNQLVLLRNVEVMVGDSETKPQAQGAATVLDSVKKSAVNGAPLVPTKQQKDAPPPNAEASVLGFLFFQKAARLGERKIRQPLLGRQ